MTDGLMHRAVAKSKILLCIPGTWCDRDEVLDKIAQGTGGRILPAGPMLLDAETGWSCEFSLSSPAVDLADAFRFGSEMSAIDDRCLERIGRHNSYLSLSSGKNGVQEAIAMAQLALAILDHGGLGVLVEGSRRASSPEQWREAVEAARDLRGLFYKVFVWAFVEDHGACCTIGMPFLGHPDIAVETNALQVATSIYHEFAQYVLIQEPKIKSGETIRFEATGGLWRITRTDHIYADDPDIDFSLGMWRLKRVGV